MRSLSTFEVKGHGPAPSAQIMHVAQSIVSRGSVRDEGMRHGGLWRTLMKPYSVRATKAMGTVEKKTPAIGIKEQMKTNRDRRPIPGMAIAHIPNAVRAVFAAAMRACGR